MQQAAGRPAVRRVVYADHIIVDSDLSGFAHAEMATARDQEAAGVAGAAAEIAAGAGIAAAGAGAVAALAVGRRKK